MNGPIIELLVLAGIAVFLILKLRNVLGTREGFEKPPVPRSTEARKPQFEVIERTVDRDIVDHVPDGSADAKALAAMKRVDPTFSVTEFIGGAKGAYEMILTAFEKGDLASVRPFLAEDVYDAFAGVVEAREKQGLTVEAEIIGVGETALQSVDYDPATKEAEITVRYTCEMTYLVRDNAGDIVEGKPNTIRKQKDTWSFARKMDSTDPNWLLVATSD
ncbi:MAG: Tim44 domain-containing protein [Rhodobacteraceae bacterium]|nr:Tim44 domain-containing protein [Paracoccaceae bacterium]